MSFVKYHTPTIIDGQYQTKLPEYHVWKQMKSRCLNPGHSAFSRYGGRGITICRIWAESFAAFYRDMGPRPLATSMIDRINNDGNYEPKNCRWVTPKESSRNTSTNRFLTINGETRTVSAWAELTGIKVKTLEKRLFRGVEPNRAIMPASLLESSTGVRGVYPKGRRFVVIVSRLGVTRYIGTFDTVGEAKEARNFSIRVNTP